jgi:sec-independent protein translocase protein TatA
MVPVFAVLSEWHIFLVLIIVFLLFGGKKLPELARGIGEAMREFKKASRDIHDDPPHATPPPAPPAAIKPEMTVPTTQNPADPKLH